MADNHFMKPFLRPVYYFLLGLPLFLTVFLFSNCAKPKPEPEVEKVKFDKLIARVESIYKEENYVLIRRYGRVELGDDSVAYTIGVNGNTANLKITGERLGQFIAADIVSGEVELGDAVYLRNIDKEEKLDNL